MSGGSIFRRVVFVCISALSALPASAGFWEISSGLNYSRSEYEGGSYAWSRRLGGSFGYNFNDSSTIEFAYQKSYERNHFQGYEDSVYDDQVYSVNWVQNIFSKESVVQPYVKLGVGQLVRNASISDSLGRSSVQKLSQVTGVLGAGIKFYLTKTFAIRMEGTSYLSEGKLNTWQNNFGLTFGGSIYF
jgi:hypothetical protein